MDIITSPRHTRQGFINRTRCARSLALSLHTGSPIGQELSGQEPFKSGTESSGSLPITAVAVNSSSGKETEAAQFLSVLANQLEYEFGNHPEVIPPVTTHKQSLNPQNLLEKMRRQARHTAGRQAEKAPLWGSMDRTGSVKLKEEPRAARTTARLEESGRSRMHVLVEILPDGQRIESFDNGSIVVKNSLGRVIEVRSTYGDCLFLDYGPFGELEAFTRLSGKGAAHSICKRDKHGVAVRDKDGRVRAAGESMTIDPWGRFYLHNLNGQYFCLDLVGGIHAERRRVLHNDGRIDYITAVFAHDGFRMATLYAATPAQDADCKRHKIGMKRSVTCRFYGRDGTMLEFLDEDDLRQRSPSRVLPPGSKAVHLSWLKHPQAQTAWESLHEYLLRQS